MENIEQYIGRRTLIAGDVKTGKTARTLKILHLFLKSRRAQNIAVLDLAPDVIQGIGGKLAPPAHSALVYLTDRIVAPRLTAKNPAQAQRLAEQNAEVIETLFVKLERLQPEVLFVNDVTLYLHAGRPERLDAALNVASTQVINAYFGRTLGDCALARRERRLTEALKKTCDRVILMK